MNVDQSITESVCGPVVSEEWRAVPGYEGLYLVSDCGRVRSLCGRRARITKTDILTPIQYPTGYFVVRLYRAGASKPIQVHRLVLAAFVGPRPEGMHVAHNNGVKADNRLVNLRYATPKENAEDQVLHGTRLRGEQVGVSRLTEVQVWMIVLLKRLKVPVRVLAEELGVSRGTIINVRRGVSWTHITWVLKDRFIQDFLAKR